MSEKKADWILRLEARQVEEPASGVHLFAASALELMKQRAKECGFELKIEQSFDE